MRRSILFILIALIEYGCNDPNAPECLKTSGNIISFSSELDTFSSIEVNNELIVTLKTGPERSITIIAGENLLPSIQFTIIDSELILSNENSCNWVRDYNFPEVVITTPELIQIRQNGGGLIKSDEALTFDDLMLISEKRTGDFNLEVSNLSVRIISNDLSNYRLTGATDKLTVGFFSGDGRFNGAELTAKEVEVFQRGTNDILVHATERLSGRIISNGNVIYTKTIPPVVDVSLEGSGKLIFRE